MLCTTSRILSRQHRYNNTYAVLASVTFIPCNHQWCSFISWDFFSWACWELQRSTETWWENVHSLRFFSSRQVTSIRTQFSLKKYQLHERSAYSYYLLNSLLITRYVWLEFRKRYCLILKSLLIKQLFLRSKLKVQQLLFFFSPPSLLLAHPFSFYSLRGTIFKLIAHKNLFFGLF